MTNSSKRSVRPSLERCLGTWPQRMNIQGSGNNLTQKLNPEASPRPSTSHWHQSEGERDRKIWFIPNRQWSWLNPCPSASPSFSRLPTRFGQVAISKGLACLLVEAYSFGCLPWEPNHHADKSQTTAREIRWRGPRIPTLVTVSRRGAERPLSQHRASKQSLTSHHSLLFLFVKSSTEDWT